MRIAVDRPGADQPLGGPHPERYTAIRILVADRQDAARVQLRELVDGTPGLELAGEAADGQAAVSLARSLRPDVVVTDIGMPGADGIEVTRRIVADPDLPTRVLVLTSQAGEQCVLDALRGGASGFLLKNARPGEVVAAIRAAVAGVIPLSPAVSRTLVRAAVGPPSGSPRRTPPAIDGLTQREREVVVLVAEGLKNAEIAERLVMSPATARTHVSRAMNKLGARDRAQLVTFAYRSGLA